MDSISKWHGSMALVDFPFSPCGSDRWGHDWLIGVDHQLFWPQLELFGQALSQRQSPAVLIAEADPLRFWVAFLGAWGAGCAVVLANPGWGDREWQPINQVFQPNRANPVQAGSSSYPCAWPLGTTADKILIPTGGTSGQLKSVIHTRESLMAAVQGFRQHFGVAVVNAYCVLPLYHVSGLMQGLRVLATGGYLAVQPYSELKQGQRLPLPPPGFLSLVPTQLQWLLDQGEAFEPWLRSFQAVLLGGAPPWPRLLHRARTLGIPLAPTYGMTETASQVATLLPQEFLAGHGGSGRALPHASLRILNPQGQPLPPTAVGTVTIAATSLAEGYVVLTAEASEPYRLTSLAPTETAGPQAPGNRSELCTDDMGYLDAAGYLHLVGRRSNKLITGGENVFPEEVEAVLLATGQVQDACVVGLPCDRWGQQLCALVVISPTLPLATLPLLLQGQLAPFKQPKRWIAIAALPRTPQGKLVRPQALGLAQRVWVMG
ncbi:MAG: 2-succinylbenzoate--CoA ligase [Leptolyngbya sp. LCM1.Bin17]|nr:MAG: 2-succinylbenzoate--CoA ligase [Leptolyngbya sp. LCM1.Bin17]